MNIVDAPMDINDIHQKLGHLYYQTLHEMISKGAVSGLKIDKASIKEYCTSCVQGKASILPFPNESKTMYTKYSEKIVTDVWGPAQVT